MTGIDRQKEYLENLFEKIDSPIFTTRNVREGNNFRPGKQKRIGSHDPSLGVVDHRSIGENEALIELDAKSFAKNAIYAKKIIEHLNNFKIPFQAFYSGGKSVHLHIYLNMDIDIKYDRNADLIGKAHQLGCDFYNLARYEFIKDILMNSELDAETLLKTDIVDRKKIKWNSQSSAPLIRCCGGRKQKVDEFGNVTTAHKTWLEVVPDKKPKPIMYIDDVAFPPPIELADIDEAFLVRIAQTYIDSISSVKLKKELEVYDYKGQFLNLPCVLQAREGMKSGMRGMGAKIVAVACRMDGLSEAEGILVVNDYGDKCDDASTFREVEQNKWVSWIYKQKVPYWSCGNCVNAGICSKEDCAYHKGKFEEDISFFKDSDPLKKVKEYLDLVVVGEDNMKMGLFILCLTKYIDPEWSIILKGDAGSGKSFIMKSVVGLFGEEKEDYRIYSRFTQTALNHLGDYAQNWNNSIIMIEEIQGAKASMEQLRVLISEGKLILMETVEVQDEKGNKSHGIEEKEVKLENTLFITCDAEDEDENQMLSRSWILNTDSSKTQTQKIINQKFRDFSIIKKNEQYNHLRVPIANALRSLEDFDDYEFPFLDELIELNLFSHADTRGRRDSIKLVRAAMAVARLYQHERNKKIIDGKRILCVDWRDIKIVFKWLGEILNATGQGLASNDMKYYQVIKLNCVTYNKTPFDNSDVAQWCKMAYQTAKKLMQRFTKDGFFNIISGNGINVKNEYEISNLEPHLYESISAVFDEKIKNQESKLAEWLK